MKTTLLKVAVTTLMLLTFVGVSIRAPQTALAQMRSNQTGYAYTLNNDGLYNGVVVLARNADGTLSEIAGSPFATGGKGLLVPNGGDFTRKAPFEFIKTTYSQSIREATASRSSI